MQTSRQRVLQWLNARRQQRTLWLYGTLLSQEGQPIDRLPALAPQEHSLLVKLGWIDATLSTLTPAGQVVAEQIAIQVRDAAHPLLLPLADAWKDEGRRAQEWAPSSSSDS